MEYIPYISSEVKTFASGIIPQLPSSRLLQDWNLELKQKFSQRVLQLNAAPNGSTTQYG